MTRDQILVDIYTRITSRKFLLTLLSLGVAYWQYQLGALTPEQFQTAVVVAVTAYLGAEAVTDAAEAFHSTPDTTVRTTVNTGTETPPAVTATTSPPVRRTRPPEIIYSDAADDDSDNDPYAVALRTVRAEEAQKRRMRDARRRGGASMTEPVVGVPSPPRRPRARPTLTDEDFG